MPYTYLDWVVTHNFFNPPHKTDLREAYRGIILDFVLDRKKTPPAITNYWKLWEKECVKLFPNFKPTCGQDVREALQLVATKAWLNNKRIDKLKDLIEV